MPDPQDPRYPQDPRDPQVPPWLQPPPTVVPPRQAGQPVLSPAAARLVIPPRAAVSHVQPVDDVPPPAITRLASGKTGGGVPTTVQDARDAFMRQDESWPRQLIASPYTGGERVYRGLSTLGTAFPGDEETRGYGVPPPNLPQPSARQIAGGASDVLGGAMEAGTLLLPEAVAANPRKMAAMLLGGTAAGTAVYAAGHALGIPPEYVDLAAETLGLAGGVASSHLVESPELQAHLLSEARRFMTEETGAVSLPTFLGAQRRGTGVTFPDLADVQKPTFSPPEQAAQPPLAPPDAGEVKALFPRLDPWGKPASHLTGSTILKRLDAAPDLAPATKAALTQLADQVGTRRISPDELHALAAGETYTPDRVLRKVAAIPEGAKQTPGAPLGVSNARQARALRERYLAGMARGVGGRDWYHDSGESILFHANDDPARARLVAGDLAITSPATSVDVNSGFGVKGYNQATAGVPVETGRFPTAMSKSVETLHAGGEGATGLKRDPFGQNIAIGGGFQDTAAADTPTRAVHDIWDAELHGYVNPDGTPMRTGFGPAQHRFMDQQQDKILAAANQRATGGFTDWEQLRSQAAGWVGQQIEAGKIDPKDAGQSFATYLAQLYAQGSRETMPGKTTGHMPELFEPGMEAFRQRLHDIMRHESGIYDTKMRDQIMAGYGGLPGASFEGPGLFQGQVSPGMQTQVLTGSQKVPGGAPGARMLDEGSRRLMNAAEATYGLGMGQDASAWSRLLPAGSGAPRGLWDVTLPGGTITPEQMHSLVLRFPNIGDMAVIPTPDGVRLGAMDDATRRSMTKMLGGTVKASGAGLETGLASDLRSNNWEVQRVGQDYFEPIRIIGTDKFDQFAPGMFDRIRKADALFAKDTNGRFTLSPVLDEVRGAVANEGWAGLERLAKKYAIPVALLATGLRELTSPDPGGSQ